MNNYIVSIAFALVGAYLIGSIPTAYILGQAFKGIDIRRFGSGNVGATNAFRILGPTWGIIVLTLDILKGIIPATLLASYFINYWAGSEIVLRIFFGFELMEVSFSIIILLLLVGFLSAIIAVIAGVGGGVFYVSIMTIFFFIPIHIAVDTSTFIILISSFIGFSSSC